MDEIAKLLAAARESRLVIFAGAGVSMGAPSHLPSWRDATRIVVRALAASAANSIGDAEASAAAELILARHAAEKLPPEYQAQVLAEFLQDQYFEVLRHLDSDHPNPTHLAIAWLAKLGCVRAVITTNFDRLIERAFAAVGAPLECIFLPADFSALAADGTRSDRGGEHCVLLKLHGSVDDPATLIDTLAQRKQGLAAPVMDCVRRFLHLGHWLFLGFSGLDLEAEENYLALRQEAGRAMGFTWLVRTNTAPKPAVVRLAQLYGGRGGLVNGDLPEWLLDFTGQLSPEAGVWISEYIGRLPPVDGMANTRALETGAGAWAQGLTSRVSALALAFVVIACAEPQAAAGIVARLLHALEVRRALQGYASEGFALLQSLAANALGILLAGLGRPEEAVHWLTRAVALAEEAGDDDTRDRWRGNLAASLEALGHISEAHATYQSALEGYRARGDPVALAFGLSSLASYLIRQFQLDEAHAHASEAVRWAAAAGDERLRGTALNNLGLIANLKEDYASALLIFEEIEALFARLGDDSSAATAAGNRADVIAALGRGEEAMAIQRAVLKVHQRLGSGQHQAVTCLSLGSLERTRGDLAAAAEWFAQARQLYQELHDPVQEARALLRLAALEAEAGRGAAALEWAEAGLALVAGRNGAFTSDLWNQIGRASLQLGRLPRAEEAYRAVCELTSGLKAPRAFAAASASLGTVLLLQQRDEAAAVFARAHRLWADLGDDDHAAQCALGQAAVLLDQKIADLSAAGHAAADPDDQRAAAREMLGLYPELIAMYEKFGAPALAAEFCSSAASSAAFVGDADAAIGWYRRAGHAFQELGATARARPLLTRAETLLQRSAQTLLQRQDMSAAFPVLLQLGELAGELGHAAVRGNALLNAAIALLQISSDFTGARTLASEALSLVGTDPDDAAMGRKVLAYCESQLKSG